MPALLWLSISLVLSPAGFWLLELRDPDWASLAVACCALSAAVVGAFFARTRAQYHVHAVLAFFLALFLFATNVYFLM